MKLINLLLFFPFLYAYGYKPTGYVINMHNIPPNTQPSNPTYFNSLLAVPLLIFFVSVLILVLFLLYVFSRYVKGKCCPRTKIPFLKALSEVSSMYWEPDFEKRKYYYRYSIISFFLFLFACFCANVLVFFGGVQVTSSLQITSSAFDLAALIFFGLAYYANELDVGLNNVTSIASSFPCNDALAYALNQSSFDSDVQNSASFASFVVDIAKSAGIFTLNAATTTNTVGIHDKDVIIYVYFAAITIVVAFFVIAYFMASKYFFTVMIMISAVFVFLLTILHCLLLFAMHFVGDACYDPYIAVLNLVQSSDVQQVLQHYATCQDQNASSSSALGTIGTVLTDLNAIVTNPLFEYLNNSYFYLEAANSTFVSGLPAATYYLQQASLSTQCLTNINTQLQKLASFANLAYDKIQCLPLATVWIEGVNNGICTDGFTGMTNIWIVALLNCLMLFGAMVSATIFMPIFIEQEPDDPMNEEESIDVCDGSVEATGDTTVDGNQQLEKVPQDGDIEINTLTNSSKQNVDEVAETGTLLVPQDNEDGNAVEKDESELFGITNVT